MSTVKPAGKVLKSTSTHTAIKVEDKIQIWMNGIKLDGYESKPEYLYSIPLANEDDLFSIFEKLEEDNRLM